MTDAQAKRDFQAMAKLAQEMQHRRARARQKNMSGKKNPIHIQIQTNSNPGATIDPDAVLFEKTGVIAWKKKNEGTDETGRARVFSNPIKLKNTKQLSRVDLKTPEKGVSSKTAA